MRIPAVIALRPFLRIADGTYGTQVRAGHEITLGIVLYQIRERQVAGIGMMGMTTHHQTERTHLTRPEQITVACCLRTAFRYPLMNRTQFIHMVRLVTSRTRIEEREHTGYQQRTLMVRHGVRSGKDSAGLTVHALAVREEQTLARRIVFVEDTTLAHEAFIDQRTIAYLHTRADDEINAFHTTSQAHRSGLIGVDRTILQPTHTD